MSCLMVKNLILGSDFVSMSSFWYSPLTNSTCMSSLSTHSLMKWHFMSMCLLLPRNNGFFISAMADLLSTLIVTFLLQNVSFSFLSVNSVATVAVSMYLVSSVMLVAMASNSRIISILATGAKTSSKSMPCSSRPFVLHLLILPLVRLVLNLLHRDMKVAHLTHVSEMEKKIETLARITTILKGFIQNKDRVIARLQQPFPLEYIPIEAEYQKDFSELLQSAASDYGTLAASESEKQEGEDETIIDVDDTNGRRLSWHSDMDNEQYNLPTRFIWNVSRVASKSPPGRNSFLQEEILKLRDLGADAPTGVPCTKEEILVEEIKGKQQGHIAEGRQVADAGKTMLVPGARWARAARLGREWKGGSGNGKGGSDIGDDDEGQ
nr:augmin subunit 2 [Tanacetum cinerariifolium]